MNSRPPRMRGSIDRFNHCRNYFRDEAGRMLLLFMINIFFSQFYPGQGSEVSALLEECLQQLVISTNISTEMGQLQERIHINK